MNNAFNLFQDYLDDMEGRISNSPSNSLSIQRPHSVANLPQTGAAVVAGGPPKNGSSGPPKRRSSVSDGAESLSRFEH